MAEKRFLVLVRVEYEEELEGGRATDAALGALEGMGRLLFPAFAEDSWGEERTVSLAGMEILGEGHVQCGLTGKCASGGAAGL
jgi:hypothetical protein